MALISFGGSKQQSQQSSEGRAFGVSGSRSASTSSDVATSRGGSQATESIAFADVFSSLFKDAAGVAGGITGLNAEAESLFSGGLNFLSQLEGGGPALEFLESRVAGENPLLDDQIGQLQADLGEFFNETILPGITSDAVGGYTLGGSRQGVAEGIAAEGLLEEFGRGVTELRSQDIERRDTTALNLLESQRGGAAAGLSALPGLFSLAQQGQVSELAPFQALAGILGQPTVLGESTSFSESDATAVAQAMSEAFGFDFAVNKSQGTSSGKSLSLGFT